MKRKKIASLALASLLTLALLTACGSPQQGAAQTAENQAEQTEQGVALESRDVTPESANDGVLHIAKQGLFSAGGTVTEPVEGEYNPALSWTDPTLAGTTAHIDHANVFYQIPVNDNGHPIVYLHGYGQSRMGWQTTPDGREGWSDLFLKMGHSALNSKQKERLKRC